LSLKKSTIIASVILALTLGVIFYASHRPSGIIVETPSIIPQPHAIPTLKSFPEQKQAGTPEPPPRPVGPTPQSNQEQSRTLAGATKAQLRKLERYLPKGAEVAIYPVSMTEERAAITSADLNGDGRKVVVVFKMTSPKNETDDKPLFLGVLSPEGDNLSLTSSVRLSGVLIYVSLYDKLAVPFAIRDVTGDGRPEIIVTSGVGASLGGALQVYSFDGSSLHQIGNVGGHILDLKDKGRGKPSEISAQSRYEAQPRTYRWNGHDFEP
jgi:hypothetical protein